MRAVQLFSSVVDEIRCDMRRLRVEDCVVALRIQQHLVKVVVVEFVKTFPRGNVGME